MDEMTLTEQLRDMCDKNNVPWSSTMYRNGKPYESDEYTTIGRGSRSLTFFEEDGAFECVVGMTVYEAFAASMCAWAEGGEDGISDRSET